MRILPIIACAAFVLALAATPSRVSAQDGAAAYEKSCAMCHGGEGKGDGPAAAAMDPAPPDLTNADGTGKLTDEQLSEVIENGKGSMPGFGAMLKPEEAKALAAYVRSLSAEEKAEKKKE